MKSTPTLLTALLLAPLAAQHAAEKAPFIVPPEVFIHHTPERSFIGPGMFRLENGDILMAAPWGRPPTNFEQLAAKFPVPMLYRSTDGGRTWKEQGRMKMEWSLPGMVSDGGVSFLRLKDGRLAALMHRHVKGLHGGGLPAISFSSDDGATWTPARLVGEPEGVWYVMNDRLIQLRSGRLLVPVSHMPQGMGTYEGDKNLGLCFFSDDGGQTWGRSREPAKLDDARGMAEPCVAEVDDRILMLARTGSGYHFSSWSDDGGDTWSKPEATTLESACSSLTLKTLPDGRLIVFYNHANQSRRVLPADAAVLCSVGRWRQDLEPAGHRGRRGRCQQRPAEHLPVGMLHKGRHGCDVVDPRGRSQRQLWRATRCEDRRRQARHPRDAGEGTLKVPHHTKRMLRHTPPTAHPSAASVLPQSPNGASKGLHGNPTGTEPMHILLRNAPKNHLYGH